MITKYSKKEIQIANKYDIDEKICAINTDENNGILVMQELNYDTSDLDIDFDMKKLIAIKFNPNPNPEKREYPRAIVGELDYSIHTGDVQNTIKVDDYAALNQEVLKNLFKFLEERAIAFNANQVELCTYLFKEPKFLEELGYKCYGVENNTISAWAKQNPTKYQFNTTLKDLEKKLTSASEK